MQISKYIRLLALFCTAFFAAYTTAAEPETATLVADAVEAAGGEDKLLKLFRIKERLNVSSDPEKKGNERVSVLEPPNYWWLGKKERVRD